MADEITHVTLLGNQGDPIEITVSATTAIPKGTLMAIDSSPQTATAADTDGDYVIGLTQVEKTATDGVTKMMVLTHFTADIKATAATGSMVLGKPVKITGANTVAPADADTMDKSMEAFGIAMETVTAGNSGEVLVSFCWKGYWLTSCREVLTRCNTGFEMVE